MLIGQFCVMFWVMYTLLEPGRGWSALPESLGLTVVGMGVGVTNRNSGCCQLMRGN